MNVKPTVPIPALMGKLPLDKRGYPIPCMVQYDSQGVPLFAVNNEHTRQRVILGGLCSICGNPLKDIKWLVGGALSAFHENGAYFDPPMHFDCITYALKVCPYLAWSKYTGKTNTDKIQARVSGHYIVEDNTVIEGRPMIFVAVRFTRLEFIWEEGRVAYVKPLRPYSRVEYWKHGQRISNEEAAKLIEGGIMEETKT